MITRRTSPWRGRARTGAAVAALAMLVPAPVAAAEGGWNALFSVDVGLMIWTIATFLMLLLALRAMAWKPLLGALDARENRIRDAIREAERLRAEAEDLASEHRKQIAEARRQAQEIVSESREAANAVRAEIEEKARSEGAALVERARREIEQEKAAAIESLRKESVELALSAASKLIDKNLDADSNRALVVDYLSRLDDTGAQA